MSIRIVKEKPAVSSRLEVVGKVANRNQTDRKRLSDEECSRGKMPIERGFMSR
ncbi:hypothetical protein [Shouchella clausii]|uniref:hypothetical protein n=1 Tax=Shouchella clausii TaxID=79880 RepID=UPI0031838113